MTVPIPAANPRYDRICRDSVTGALTFTKGAEAANPAVPAIPSTTAVPVCNLFTQTSTVALTHASNIIDKRNTPGVGAAFGTETLLAAASTTDLGTIASHNVNVGTNAGVSITSFGSSASTANPIYIARWTVAGTITNGANILCAGGANISVNAGDVYILEYMGSGVWRVDRRAGLR